jgi:hypothetical protein
MNDSKPQKMNLLTTPNFAFCLLLQDSDNQIRSRGRSKQGLPVLHGSFLTSTCGSHGFHTNEQITQWLEVLPQIPAWGSMLRRLKGIAETHSNTQEPACYRGSRTAKQSMVNVAGNAGADYRKSFRSDIFC